MFLTKHTSMIGFWLAVVFLTCTAADAQMGKGRGSGGAGGGMFPGCSMSVELTSEQSTAIQEHRSAFFKDTAVLRADIFKKEQELDILMLEPTVDLEKAKSIQDEISGLYGQIAQKKLLHQIDIRKLLTPDQLRQLPPGCGMGIGPCGRGCGMGSGMGYDGRGGRGRGPRWQND